VSTPRRGADRGGLVDDRRLWRVSGYRRIVEALDGATQVTVQFEVESTNVLGSLVQRLFGRRLMASTRTAMERDLADIASAAAKATVRNCGG